MDNPAMYEINKGLPKRDVALCLREYGSRIRWRGQDRVVDLGCGDGGTTAGALRGFLPKDFEVLIGCDVSARMVQHARSRHRDARTDFREMDLGAPLPHDIRGCFDHAFSFHAIHWVHDQERVFTNIYGLLKPGGDCLLLFMTRQPVVDAFRMVGARAEWRTRNRMRDLRFLAYHDTEKPEETVRALMENSGFKNVVVEHKVMTYTYETLDTYKGMMVAVSPFDVPDELSEEYARAHLQAVRDLNIPTYRLEEGDTPGEGRLHLEYGIIIASATK